MKRIQTTAKSSIEKAALFFRSIVWLSVTIALYSSSALAHTDQRFLLLESYPWAFYENDQVRGASVDWLDDLARRHHFILTPIVTTYARGVELLKRGEIDYMVAPNSARYRELSTPAFPIMTVPMVLVARPGLSLTATENLMALKSLGVVAGLTFDEITMDPLPLPPTEDVQPASGLRRMSTGRLDALIISTFGLEAEATRQDIPIYRWPQRPIGSITLSLFTSAKAASNPQTPAVLRAVKEARDTRSYLPFVARYLAR